jgi:hypothetical protein
MNDDLTMMPIVYPGSYRFAEEVQRLRRVGLCAFVIAVPMEMMDGHNDRCVTNHGLSLRGLANRGGCSARDALAMLQDKHPGELGNKDQAVYHKMLLREIHNWELVHG